MPSSLQSSVTALVPAWQAAEFIQPTLDCLSNQTYQNLQVIVSVDLCEDETYNICLAHAQRDSRFSIERHEKRLNYTGNCNFLLQQATSDYALFAFHDDILDPTCIKELAALLDARQEVILSFPDTQLEYVDGQKECWQYIELEGVKDPTARAQLIIAGKDKWWVPNRGLFRLPLARRINGVKKNLAGEFAPDWPWLLHMSLLGEFARVPKVLCYKFYQPASLSRNWKKGKPQQLAVRIAHIREILASRLSVKEKYQLTVFALRRLYWRMMYKVGHKVVNDDLSKN